MALADQIRARAAVGTRPRWARSCCGWIRATAASAPRAAFTVWEGGGEYNVVRGLRRCFGLRYHGGDARLSRTTSGGCWKI